MKKEKKVKNRKILTGEVISNKMNKTCVVKVLVKKKHKKYLKIRTISKKYKVHCDDTCQIGDVVKFVQCRPISKEKSWRILKK